MEPRNDRATAAVECNQGCSQAATEDLRTDDISAALPEPMPTIFMFARPFSLTHLEYEHFGVTSCYDPARQAIFGEALMYCHQDSRMIGKALLSGF